MSIHHEIIDYLEAKDASFRDPKSSSEIGCDLNVTPSYVRLVIKSLLVMGKVRVRRGRGGGYYL
jgi:DNA-binding IscR family transcriptional regulator